MGPAAIIGAFQPSIRRSLLLLVLAWSIGVIFLAAEPFAEALVHTGHHYQIDEFLLVQWVAPLASEAPEFAVASLLVLRGGMSKGLLTLVSSKVNQWTLLVGTLPVVTSISAATPRALTLDTRQVEEVLLTAAQSLFGVILIARLGLDRRNAIILGVLFFGQLLVPSTEGRFVFGMAYLGLSVLVLIAHQPSRDGLVGSQRALMRYLRGRQP